MRIWPVVRSRIPVTGAVIAALFAATSLGSHAQDATPTPNDAPPGVALTQLSGRIVVDGSSTVWPIMVAAAEHFGESASNVIVEVEFSGTGGRFREVQAFVRFTLDQATELVDMVGYVPLPATDYATDRAELEALLVAAPAA